MMPGLKNVSFGSHDKYGVLKKRAFTLCTQRGENKISIKPNQKPNGRNERVRKRI
jgi:hypothetical protein